MKKLLLPCMVGLVSLQAGLAQGIFVYDQQSSTEMLTLEGGITYRAHPIQSFTPTLDSIGFVRLFLMDVNVVDARMNVRAGSPTGPVLGTTLPFTAYPPVTAFVTFVFPTPVSLTPGQTYFLEATTRLGGGYLNAAFYGYTGGLLFSDNNPLPYDDLWFREGIIIPEPGAAVLWVLGGALVLCRRSRRLSLGPR